MAFLRISDFAFAGLSHVFTPPGMPLVEKSVGVPPTTSVLVRGAAGTGKSTLALAVAHAIARASNGMVLYLVTEASLSDVAYKAELLALPAPVAFSPDTTYEPGAIGVTHLVLEHEEAAGESTAAVQRRALDTIEELLEKRSPTVTAPVRAIVIDGFGLPEANDGQGPTRSDLIGFIQGLEDQGISPVLIEETGDAHSPLLTFAVDVVFAIAFDRNADTGELMRQLVVSKSRYSDSSPGPHDAVLADGKPALWPRTTTLDFGPERSPVGFFMPLLATAAKNAPARVVAINRGALILALYDKDHQATTRAFRAIPSVNELTLDCGPVSHIARDGLTRPILSSHGPAALLWALHEALADGTINAILIYKLEHLLARPRFAAFIPELLDQLTRRGFLVCVHGKSGGLAPVDDIARFTGPTGHHQLGDSISVRSRKFRAASTWSQPLMTIERPVESSGLDVIRTELIKANEKLRSGDFAAAAHCIENQLSPTQTPAGLRLRVEQLLLLDRLGKARTASSSFSRLTSQDNNALAALGWALEETGNYGEACQVALKGIDRDDVAPEIALLWNCLWLRFTRTPVHTSVLFPDSAEPPPLQARAIAHAAAAREEILIADELLTHAAERAGMGKLTERLLADARMESTNLDHWRDAAKRYDTILQQSDLSPLDHADILFNRGHIHERFDERDAAIAKYQEALRVNPLLEPALDRLQALGIPFSLPTPPTSSN